MFYMTESEGPTQSLQYGSVKLKAPDGLGEFLSQYTGWLGDTIRTERVDTVVFEQPFVGVNTHQQVARKLMSLSGLTELVCWRADVDCHEANNASVRKHFIGKGRGKRADLKAMTIQACQDKGWGPQNDDEADALALLDYAAHLFKMKTPWPSGPLFAEPTTK